MNKYLLMNSLHLVASEHDGVRHTIKYRKKSTGELIVLDGWVVSSWHSSGTTLNVRHVESGQVRKLHRILIMEWDGVRVVA